MDLRKRLNETVQVARDNSWQMATAGNLPEWSGRFAMGSPETADEIRKVFSYAKKEWFSGERPVHRVTISRPFYLARCEVTLSTSGMHSTPYWCVYP